MNVFTFTGNIGQDCEVRQTQGGMTICSFSAAVSSGFGDKRKTTWVKCSLFGKRAEGQLPQYLVKGAKVAVSGELSMDEWTGNDGAVNKTLSLAVDKVDLIGDKPQGQQQAPQNYQQAPQQAPQQGGYQQQPPQQQAPQQAPMQQQQQAPQSQQFDNSFDDDIPF